MKIKEKILSNSFLPSLPWGLVNPFFINRKLLAESIKSQAHHLHGKILDYGCGSMPYKTLFKFDEYTGVDIENPAHSHANENIDIFFDGKNLPFKDDMFESCFASEVFEHVFEPDRIVQEIKRVIKPGGNLLITTPFVWDEHEAPHDYCRYTTFGLKYLLENNGFEIVAHTRTGSFLNVIFQLKLIYLNRTLASSRIFKFPFYLIICPFINILSLISDVFFKRSGHTIYLGHVLVARKKYKAME